MSPARKREQPCSGVVKIGIVVLVVCLGLWGCARKPAGQATADERVRVLENRCQKLELDYRTVTQARDKARKEVTRLEEEKARLLNEVVSKVALVKERDELRRQLKNLVSQRDEIQGQLALRTTERDDLKLQVVQRINERDALAHRCEKFRKGLQQLLTDDDHPAPTMPPTPTPTTSVNLPALGGQS
jgi:hypothetical protein